MGGSCDSWQQKPARDGGDFTKQRRILVLEPALRTVSGACADFVLSGEPRRLIGPVSEDKQACRKSGWMTIYNESRV